MNCRDFLNEFEERKALTETAMLHLNDCAGCKKVNDEQTRVWQMIETLPTVDAPKDFDFRLKARIASAKPADFQPRFSPALRYVLPLSLAVFVFAFVIFNSVSLTNNTTVPQVAESFAPPQIEKQTEPIKSPFQETSATSVSKSETSGESVTNFSTQTESPRPTRLIRNEKQFIAVKSERALPVVRRKDSVKTDFGASRDSASTSARVIVRKNNNYDKTVKTVAPNLENQNSTATEQMLSQIGVETVSENGNRKVKSLKQNGIAERSGVKVGDVIEAIDGKKLTDQTPRGKQMEAKKITVVRDAAKKEISLRH